MIGLCVYHHSGADLSEGERTLKPDYHFIHVINIMCKLMFRKKKNRIMIVI